MSFENGWCDECHCPIGVGSCGGCVAYASVSADLGEDDCDEDANADDDSYNEDEDGL